MINIILNVIKNKNKFKSLKISLYYILCVVKQKIIKRRKFNIFKIDSVVSIKLSPRKI